MKMVAEKDFKINELVWAKMKNFPFWPAKIVNPPAVEGTKKKSSTHRKAQHYVFFFGSENYAWILDENIVPHSEEMLNKVAKKKSAAYVKAIEKIVEISNSITRKPVLEDYIKKEITETAVKGAENNANIPSIKVEKLPKKRGVPKQMIKCEKTEKFPQKRDLPEDESDEELSPVQKLFKKYNNYSSPILNTPPNAFYSRVAVIRPLEDQSAVSEEYFGLPLEPSVAMSESGIILKHKNVKPTTKKIGFLGLGVMGQRMVKNLINSGHNVSVWNRTPEKCEQFIDMGAQQYLTPADVVSNCDIIFCCVSGSEAVKSVVFESSGVLQGLEKCREKGEWSGEKGYVEMTAVDPITSQKVAEAITSKGGKYLEAPISGSRSLAEEGSLLLIAAGDPELLNSCESCFFAMSKNVYYLSSEVGNGSRMSLVLSMVLGTTYAALAETMALVERCNLSRNKFLEILELCPLTCPLLVEKGRSIVVNNFSTNTTLKYQQQHFNLGLELGEHCEQPMALASAANELFKRAKLLRYTENDVSAIYLGAKY